MADALGINSFHLSDPTTASQQAGVDASGNVKVIAASNSGVDIGDVDVTSIVPGTGATNLGKAEDAVHTTGDVGVYMLAVRDDSLAAHSGTDGDYESIHTNASGAVWVAGNGTFTVLDATVGTNTTDLPNVIGTDGGAGPSKAVSVGGTDGSGNLQELLTDTDGHLQVDVLSGGGSNAPTNPVIDITAVTTPVEVAGNLGTGNLDSADVATKKLRQACVVGSRAFIVTISTLSGGVATAVAVGSGGPGNPFIWEPPHEDFAVCGTTVGGFRAAVINLDPVDATDFRASFAYND